MQVLHFSKHFRQRTVALAFSMLFTLGIGTLARAQDDQTVGPPAPSVDLQTIERDGISIEFMATPSRPEITAGQIMEADFANLEFRIRSTANDEPLRGSYPGVWIDLVKTPEGQQQGTSLECRPRVSNYLQGLVGMRPMIDLNSYFVLVLNQDASISVIDPVVGITGITSLYTSVRLERPGADWAKTQDEKTLFVSMPRAGKVAVIDLDSFKVEKNITVGEMPMRVAIQPDQRYLWVGHDLEADQNGSVSVIDIKTEQIVASIPTGKGHHEISFSGDSSRAFVTNRDSGTVSIVDIEKLESIADVDVGWVPIAVDYSNLSESAYVADGVSGMIAVIDSDSGQRVAAIETSSGLGPLRFSKDGRWGFAVNPEQNQVYVIDASTNTLAHTVAVSDRPFQVTLTETFAYIRTLDSERISMINLQELNRGGEVIVNNFAAGSFPPGQVNDIRIADAMVPAAQESAVLVVSPADATVYYYMEGMNAPMGAFRNYGHKPRAVEIANRALKETSPGVYSATIKVPMAGTFEVAFLNETPQILHCFTMQAAINPNIERDYAPVAVQYLSDRNSAIAGDNVKLRFRLYEPGSGKAINDAGYVTVKFYRAPRFDLTELLATPVGDGIYEADLELRNAGLYYVYVSAPALNAGYQDLNFRTIAVASGRTASSDTPGR